jgi:uncharacterized membrane protein YGL010W
MRRIDELFDEYAENHRNPTNKTIHWICVPSIYFSIVGLVASIPAGTVRTIFGPENPYAHWATIGLALALIYYVTLSIPLSVGMMFFSLGCLFLVRFLADVDIAPVWMISVIIFILAWIGQFYGHKIEGRKPSFLKDIQFLLIGPAWLMHFIYKRLGIPY